MPLTRDRRSKSGSRGTPYVKRNRSKVTPREPVASPLNSVPAPPAHLGPSTNLWLWGDADFNRLGKCPFELGLYKPTKNSWLRNENGVLLGGEGVKLVAVAAGGIRSAVLDEDGTLWSWGDKDNGALGRQVSDSDDEAIPSPLHSLVEENFQVVKCVLGNHIGAALSIEGDLRVWGAFRTANGELFFSHQSPVENLPVPVFHPPQKFTSIAAGPNHLLSLTTHGDIYSWGIDEDGRLGRRPTHTRSMEGHPAKPSLVLLGPKRGKGKKAVYVGAGSKSSFAVDESGDVWGWGMNGQGQTGTGYPVDEREIVLVPQRVVGLSKAELKANTNEGSGGDEETVVQIEGGSDHTLFLTSQGRVFSCGRSTDGQLGFPSDHPSISRRHHTIAGISFTDTFAPLPTLIVFPTPTSMDPVKHIAVGEHNNLAVTRDGAMYVWGSGCVGELGRGMDVNKVEVPEVLVRRSGGTVEAISVACAGSHCLGLFRRRT